MFILQSYVPRSCLPCVAVHLLVDNNKGTGEQSGSVLDHHYIYINIMREHTIKSRPSTQIGYICLGSI